MSQNQLNDSNIYTQVRNKLGLSREKAAELLETISPEKIERIEKEKQLPSPEDVMIMAEKYGEPNIRNYYCAKQCPMGQHFVPEIRFNELERTVLQLVAAMNSMQSKQERLIEIAADGKVSEDELKDMIKIEEDLERVSIAADTMKLWVETMLSSGAIDTELYNKLKNE